MAREVAESDRECRERAIANVMGDAGDTGLADRKEFDGALDTRSAQSPSPGEAQLVLKPARKRAWGEADMGRDLVKRQWPCGAIFSVRQGLDDLKAAADRHDHPVGVRGEAPDHGDQGIGNGLVVPGHGLLWGRPGRSLADQGLRQRGEVEHGQG